MPLLTKKPDWLSQMKNQPGWAVTESQSSARLAKQLAIKQIQLAIKLATSHLLVWETKSIKQAGDLINITPRTPKKVLDHCHTRMRNP